MKHSIWVNLSAGIWLIVAPFVLGAASPPPAWIANDLFVGILLVAFSWWMLAETAPPISVPLVELACGIWLLFAPFLLRYRGTTAATANDVVCGIIVIASAALASGFLMRRWRDA